MSDNSGGDISIVFKDVIREFTESIDCIRTIFDAISGSLSLMKNGINKKFIEKYNIHKIPSDQEGALSYEIKDSETYIQFENDLRKLGRISIANKLLPRNGIINLVNIYDKLIADMIGLIYDSKPEMVKGSKRQLTIVPLPIV